MTNLKLLRKFTSKQVRLLDDKADTESNNHSELNSLHQSQASHPTVETLLAKRKKTLKPVDPYGAKERTIKELPIEWQNESRVYNRLWSSKNKANEKLQQMRRDSDIKECSQWMRKIQSENHIDMSGVEGMPVYKDKKGKQFIHISDLRQRLNSQSFHSHSEVRIESVVKEVYQPKRPLTRAN